MDTLKASKHLEQHGFSKEQAEALTTIINEVGRLLVTKNCLWQHTATIIVANAATMGLLLKVFS